MNTQYLAELVEKTGYKTTQSLEFLRSLVERVKPNYVLELGTAFGASAAYMAIGIGDGKVVSIDNYSGMYAKGVDTIRDTMEQIGVSDNVILLKGNTHEVGVALRQVDFVISPEIVFMDADHAFSGMTAEYNAFSSILPENHIIIVDDYIASGADAKRFVSDKTHQYEFSVTIKSFHWGMAVFCTNSDYLVKIADSVQEVTEASNDAN